MRINTIKQWSNPMVKSMCIALLYSSSIACSNKEKAKEDEGFIPLFDGKTTMGWHRFNDPTSIGKAWDVQDGTLHLNVSEQEGWQTRNGGDIVSDNVYDDFDLKLEWKIAKNGNSGIMIYVQEDTAYQYPWQTGPEMQVLDNEGHPDSKIPKHRAGDLYDLISSEKETVKKAGEWNEVEIIAYKGKLQFFLNGTRVIETTLWNENWKKMIASSKFKDMLGFGTFQLGHIALQDHGNEVWFRNIRIKEL